MGTAVALACLLPWMLTAQGTRGAVAIDADDIGGVVTGAIGLITTAATSGLPDDGALEDRITAMAMATLAAPIH